MDPATPEPDPITVVEYGTAGAYSAWAFTWGIEAGSAQLENAVIFLPEEAEIQPLSVDPDGRIGQFSESRPFTGTFVPTGGSPWDVWAIDDFTAFVDQNGDTVNDPLTEVQLSFAGGDIIDVYYPTAMEAQEAEDVAWRLNLQRTLIVNPSPAGDFDVTVVLISVCRDGEILADIASVEDPVCVPSVAEDDLATSPPKLFVKRLTDGRINLTWGSAKSLPDGADPCAERFAVYATGDPALPTPSAPSTFTGRWVNLTGEDDDGSELDRRWTSDTPFMYYLIVREGPEGELGPLGHYGL
jgi:hypothetical protein